MTLHVPRSDFEVLSPQAFQDLKQRIDSIDLTMVKQKLMDHEEGQGWSSEYVEHVEIRYRRYLCMLRLSPTKDAVPTKEIDLFWHQHILDTRAYADDCERVFGGFVHHFPYFGMRGAEDAQDLLTAFERTKILYASLFGESYTDTNGSTATTCHKCSSTCKKCSSGCSGVKCMTCKSK